MTGEYQRQVVKSQAVTVNRSRKACPIQGAVTVRIGNLGI